MLFYKSSIQHYLLKGIQKEMKYGVVIIHILLFSIPVHAQSPYKLTLDEAVQLSVKNSKDLNIADAKIQEAIASVQEAKSRAYPDLKISGAYLRLNSANVDLKADLGKADEENTENANNSVKIDQAVYGMANLSFPIYSGSRIKNGVKVAEHLEKSADFDGNYENDMLVQTTIAAYFNLYKAQAAVRLVRNNLKQAKQRVQDFRNLEENGLLARNDLLKSQLQASNVSLALLDAENDEKTAKFNLDLMLGLDEDTQLLLDTNWIMEEITPHSLEEWESIAIKNRGDYQSLLETKEAAHNELSVMKGGYYPTLALTGGYVAIQVPDFVTVTNAVNVGLGIQYNLADIYKIGAKVKQAKAKEQQLFWSIQKLNDNVRIQIHQAYQNYYKSIQKVEVYQEAIEQAHENFRITKNKYDNALASTTDLLDADVSELQAQINFEFAKADELIARNKLLETAGILDEEIN